MQSQNRLRRFFRSLANLEDLKFAFGQVADRPIVLVPGHNLDYDLAGN
jgi:hypothetical protein